MTFRALSGRAARLAFWVGLPLTLMAMPLQPRRSVVYVSWDPFSIELNPIRSSLPPPLDELSFFYPATLLGLGVLILCVIGRPRWGLRYRPWPGRLPVFFLPTCLAGIESVGVLLWSMRCHSVTAPPSLEEVVESGLLLTTTAFAITILTGALAASVFGHRARNAMPVPAVVFPIVAAVTLQWWFLWCVVTFP